MVENYDLKTISLMIGTGTPFSTGMGVVPTGMTRFVTFVKAQNQLAASNCLFLATAAAVGTMSTPTLASASQKDAISLQSMDMVAYPDKPNVENPLFSIAAGKYLDAVTDRGDMRLFMQYYDR